MSFLIIYKKVPGGRRGRRVLNLKENLPRRQGGGEVRRSQEKSQEKSQVESQAGVKAGEEQAALRKSLSPEGSILGRAESL